MNETVTLADFRTEANLIKEAAGRSGGLEKKVSLGPGTTVTGLSVRGEAKDRSTFYKC